MKTLFLIFVLFAVPVIASDTCDDPRIYPNHFYGKITALSIEGGACGAEGSIRMLNYAGEMWGVQEDWNRRYFQVPEGVQVIYCAEPLQCELLVGPWYKALPLTVVVEFDAKKKKELVNGQLKSRWILTGPIFINGWVK